LTKNGNGGVWGVTGGGVKGIGANRALERFLVARGHETRMTHVNTSGAVGKELSLGAVLGAESKLRLRRVKERGDGTVCTGGQEC